MPVAKFQMPDGRVARFEVPEGTTPEQAQAQFKTMLDQGKLTDQLDQPGMFQQALQSLPTAGLPLPVRAAAEAVKTPGVVEAGTAIGTGMVAEPIAGLAGIGAGVTGATPEEAAQAVESTREALTFQPVTERGKARLQQVGEALQPVGEAFQAVEKGLGDATFKATGSPALSAAAATLPTAVLEALGFGLGRKVAKTSTRLKGAPDKPKIPKNITDKAVTKSLLESAPEVSQIKDASRAIYKEIDGLRVTAKPGVTRSLLNRVIKKAKAENVDPVLTPKSARVTQQFIDELNSAKPRTLTDFDQLRKRAQIAAQSADPSDARVGAIMVDEIDDFLDKLPQGAFTGPDVKTVGRISERYRAARNLWGRARRAELVQESFDKAARQASGFENGIRVQFRQILNNKKRSRFFTKDELAAMSDVVQGTNPQNMLKLIGRLGFSEGAATNILGGLGGTAVFGPGAPVVGQISRKLAQKTTEGAARRVETLIRAGASGRKLTKAYLQTVPKGKRSVQELSDILLSSGSNVDDLLNSANKLTKEAAEITRARRIFERAQAIGAAAPQVIPEQEQP